MRTIGVRELKAHLSATLRDVQRGDVILVTDRGRVIAELRSPGGTGVMAGSPTDRALARLAADGRMRLGEPVPSPYQASPLECPAGTANELLGQERDE
jgi:antitoxin (DNA-binding transcriptional repressor) of toxin-antitoxin stability system